MERAGSSIRAVACEDRRRGVADSGAVILPWLAAAPGVFRHASSCSHMLQPPAEQHWALSHCGHARLHAVPCLAHYKRGAWYLSGVARLPACRCKAAVAQPLSLAPCKCSSLAEREGGQARQLLSMTYWICPRIASAGGNCRWWRCYEWTWY